MRELEKQLIEVIKRFIAAKGDPVGACKIGNELFKLFAELTQDPCIRCSKEFLGDKVLQEYLKLLEADNSALHSDYFRNNMAEDRHLSRLWLEMYLQADIPALKQEYFEKIRAKIIEIKSQISKPHGQGLLPRMINRELIKAVYLSEDERLIALFSEHLPVPDIALFAGGRIPSFIQKRADNITRAILTLYKFSSKQKEQKFNIESAIIEKQRKIRAKRRQKEEIARITGYADIPEALDRKVSVEQALQAANTPYLPQACSPELAQKIFKASEKIKLFSTVHHVTAYDALANIFDDCLYGRRTLLQHYLHFDPAALGFIDLEHGGGDANVICFGPNDVDPDAADHDTGAVDLVFDLDKLGSNPCMFYKQRDLGYSVDRIRECAIGKGPRLLFSHTNPFECEGGPAQNKGFVVFQFFGEDRNLLAYSRLPNYLFTSYNLPGMYQILTLNFFRFLDTLKMKKKPVQGEADEISSVPADELIKSIYDSIGALDEKELQEFLRNLAQQMTDTAEFNFYGAYRVDFSALRSIAKMQVSKSESPDGDLEIVVSKIPSYVLNLIALIKALQAGDIKALKEAEKNMPIAFESYRFLDYLLSQDIRDKTIQQHLLALRQKVISKVPPWLKERSLDVGIDKAKPIAASHVIQPQSSLASRSILYQYDDGIDQRSSEDALPGDEMDVRLRGMRDWEELERIRMDHGS